MHFVRCVVHCWWWYIKLEKKSTMFYLFCNIHIFIKYIIYIVASLFSFAGLGLHLTPLARKRRAEAACWDPMSKRKFAKAMVDASTEPLRRVLIVGTGMTGALTGYHLRQRMGKGMRLEFADMARGAGGRMSTTRWGNPEVL